MRQKKKYFILYSFFSPFHAKEKSNFLLCIYLPNISSLLSSCLIFVRWTDDERREKGIEREGLACHKYVVWRTELIRIFYLHCAISMACLSPPPSSSSSPCMSSTKRCSRTSSSLSCRKRLEVLVVRKSMEKEIFTPWKRQKKTQPTRAICEAEHGVPHTFLSEKSRLPKNFCGKNRKWQVARKPWVCSSASICMLIIDLFSVFLHSSPISHHRRVSSSWLLSKTSPIFSLFLFSLPPSLGWSINRRANRRIQRFVR